MWWSAENELYKIVKIVGTHVDKLTETDAVQIKNEIFNRYVDKTSRYTSFLWDRIKAPCVVVHERGTPNSPRTYDQPVEFVTKFFINKPLYLYFQRENPTLVFKFNSGAELTSALSYNGRYMLDEFCITDQNFSFIVIYSREPCFIACGLAMPWLEEKVAKAKAEGKDIYGWKKDTNFSRRL